MSYNDLVFIFLSLEFKSNRLYILSTIYPINYELSWTGGLIYFLLCSVSSCFILLGLSLLYANSGTIIVTTFFTIVAKGGGRYPPS